MAAPAETYSYRTGGKTCRRGLIRTRRGKCIRGIGPLKKGELTVLGYQAKSKARTRRVALKKALSRYGKASTIRKLNAIAVYTKRTSPSRSRTYRSDIKFIQKK